MGGLFGSSGSPAQVVTTNPFDQMQQAGQSGNFTNLGNENSTYLADMFSQLGTGNAPSYWQKYQNQAQPYMQKQMMQGYFGTPGNRMNNIFTGGPTGMGNAMSMASIFGLSPKAGIDQMSKVNQQYQNAEQQINQYFAGQGINLMNDIGTKLPGMATQQQDSYTNAFHPTQSVIPGVAGSSGPLPGLLGALGQGGAFNGMGSGLMSMFGGAGGAGVDLGALQAFGGGTAMAGGTAAIDSMAPEMLSLAAL